MTRIIYSDSRQPIIEHTTQEIRKMNMDIIKDAGKRASKEKNSGNFTFRAEDTIRRIMGMSAIARKEGLLALEGHLNEFAPYEQELLLLVIDGTFPEDIEEIALTDYYANPPRGHEALIKAMTLHGILLVQAGENSRIIIEKLLRYIPLEDREKARQNLYSRYTEYRNKLFNENGFPLLDIKKAWGMAETETSGKLGEKLLIMDNRALQRILREIKTPDIALTIANLPDKAIDAIEKNLSKMMRLRIHEEAEEMNPSEKTVTETQETARGVIEKLEDAGEIVISRGTETDFDLNQIFNA